ncbi:MAG: undecaprenyl-phosphate glucose phosphotransferase [Deltaproteobacteria bacterium]|nr:undecaprenyl-phosphate glucose phosphotransferase [Deltaproteobacteria bacterium]
MLKKHAQVFEILFTVSDILIVSLAWLGSYALRFYSGLVPVTKGIPPFSDYFKMLVFVALIWGFVFRIFNLYRPMRSQTRFAEALIIIRANAFSVVLFLAAIYLFREKNVEFSRLVFALFLFLSSFLLLVSRSLLRSLLGLIRSKGFNMRYAIIVGSENLAQQVAMRLYNHSEYGIDLVGCLSRTFPFGARPQHVSLSNPRSNLAIESAVHTEPVYDLNIIGSYQELPVLLAQGGIDQVIVALPLSDYELLPTIMESIGDSLVDVRIVPDYHEFIKLGAQVEELDGLPVMSVVSTPLMGFNVFVKRMMDLILGIFFFIVSLPVFIVVTGLVKLTSRGPVFYTQERMGLDGRCFRIIKFRTMYINAESRGAKFARKGDPRVTPLGKILRRFSIDEIPQLINVLLGNMSLVGPRPERPVFIEEFRRKFPRYMLRHKVQAGLTGWAQVNGWRGNTSIEKRVECDLYYIENWSPLFDLRIILLTFFKCFSDENAY